ncbi:MAG: hypothetical protein K2X98_03540 [Alphaproteobacteria bacterium]|nr:hypothetical protein [Alphaproteobacteria bacterium]
MAATIGSMPGFVTIGTVALEIPKLDASGKPTQKAPDWIVEIPDHTKGNIDGLDTYSQLFDFHYEYSRETSGHIGNETFTSAAIEHSEVALLIPTGTYTAKIRQTLNTGKVVPTITIKRLGNMTDLKKPLQIITYTDCIFARVVQDKDFFAVSFRFIKVKEENPEFKQDDEGSGGQNVCETDYAKLTVE